MTRPLVSILTPSFNQGRFLGDCLRSVATQTYSPIEHVVVDGGSTDESIAILESAGPNVAWTSEPDRGQAHAVNKAYAASSGELVGWVNSDDGLFARDTVERVVRCFAERPDVWAVYGDAAMMAADGRLLRHHRSHWPTRLRLRSGASPISQPALFVRRGALGDSGPLLREDLAMALDLELVLRLAAAGAPVVRVGRVLAVDRDHDARKLRTRWDTYESEVAALATEFGATFDDTLGDRAAAWLRRLAGTRSVLMWSRESFAGPWWVDGAPRRLIRQLARSHSAVTEGRPHRIGDTRA